MEDFYINPKIVYQILANKGVEYLYHANTVLTSLTFLNHKALLSRGYVDINNLTQTEQESDSEDKKFNVWDDIFLDGIDLHKKYKKANNYGPILFVMKLDLLQAPSLPPLLVTKNNPWYWKDEDSWEDRYFKNPEEIKIKYLAAGQLDSRIMFTFRSPGTFIKLNKYLREVIVDRPTIIVDFKSGEKKNIGDHTYEKIREALDNNSLGHIPMRFRHVDDNFYLCSCDLNYTWLKNWRFEEFFKRYRSS